MTVGSSRLNYAFRIAAAWAVAAIILLPLGFIDSGWTFIAIAVVGQTLIESANWTLRQRR